jgi:hypothetical protein
MATFRQNESLRMFGLFKRRPRQTRALIFGLSLLLLAGCRSPKSLVSLKDGDLAEGPVIIQRGDHFYLHYRPSQKSLIVTLVLEAKKTSDAGFYYFSIGSKPGFDVAVEHPLASDGLEQLARGGQVFWLEPDGAKSKMPIQLDNRQ